MWPQATECSLVGQRLDTCALNCPSQPHTHWRWSFERESCFFLYATYCVKDTEQNTIYPSSSQKEDTQMVKVLVDSAFNRCEKSERYGTSHMQPVFVYCPVLDKCCFVISDSQLVNGFVLIFCRDSTRSLSHDFKTEVSTKWFSLARLAFLVLTSFPCTSQPLKMEVSIHSIGLCRMQRSLAVLRSFSHSSLLRTFFCHPSASTILPFSLTSSCCLFLGLPLHVVDPKFIYNTLLGILFSIKYC